MPKDDSYDVRAEMLEALLQKVGGDRFPSSTMLNWIEELLTPEDVPIYVELLLDRVRSENFPSIPMLARIKRLV
jgi:hypothetical protein